MRAIKLGQQTISNGKLVIDLSADVVDGTAEVIVLLEERPLQDLMASNPEAWLRKFENWAQAHDPKLPVLSAEATSRESLYEDRW